MSETSAWIGWQVGMTGPAVKLAKEKIKSKFSYGKALDDTQVFGADLQIALITYQNKKNADPAYTGPKLRTDGVLDYNTQDALGMVFHAPPEPVSVCLSINGAGSTWSQGYPYDIGETLDKSRCWHQPIGYDTTPVPMMRGVATGVTEVIRQLDMPRGSRGLNCTVLPWQVVAYSMGSIVWMTVLMRVLYGDLGRFKATYMGSSSFGNPMRQANHSFPGGIAVDGEGIVSPTAHDVPDAHWDFTALKGMVGAPGTDMYAHVGGADKSDLTVADERSVWKIVATGNPLSLAEALLMLVAEPSFKGTAAAAGAAFEALGFFVVHGITAHTSYQFVQPIDGDLRSCWDIAREHAADMVARLPRAIAS